MPEPALTARQEAILHAVCRDYVVHGGGVASKTLVRAYGFGCSSATLRQELAALEGLGLVRRPHRSAGCSPTTAGLSRYVGAVRQQVAGKAPDANLARAVDLSLSTAPAARQTRMRAAVCVLSEAAGCLAVTFLGGGQADRVRTLDLVPLVGGRLLAVVEMAGGATHMHTIELDAKDAEASRAPLESLRAQLRRLCEGRTLDEARRDVVARMGEREAQVDRILYQALALGLVLCQRGAIDPLWLTMAGGPSLARTGVDGARLGDVLALLEDDQRLAGLLTQLVGGSGEEGSARAQVHVGADALLHDAAQMTGDPDGPTLTLVGCPVPVAGRSSGAAATSTSPPGGPAFGAVALIGPDRMDYAAVIPLVEYAARALAATMDA